MRRKCANQLRDHQYKISRVLVDNTKANTIIIGDLDMKGMASEENGDGRGLNRSLQSIGMMGRFVGFLIYKAKLVGKKVIEISEEDATKECCVCGGKGDRPLHERIIRCDCGNVVDRDLNSVINIMKRFLSQERSVDELSFFMDGILRQTGWGYARKLTPKHSQEAPS